MLRTCACLWESCDSNSEKIVVINIILAIVQISSNHEYLTFCDSKIDFFARLSESSIIVSYNLQVEKSSCNACRDMYRRLSRTCVYAWNVNLIIVRKNDNWKFDSICLMRFVIKNFKSFILSVQISYSFNWYFLIYSSRMIFMISLRSFLFSFCSNILIMFSSFSSIVISFFRYSHDSISDV